MGLEFAVVAPVAEEAHHEQFTARELCQLNAYRKARSVAKRHPGALVLGADTLVSLGTRLFGKPATRPEAFRMLGALSGQTHQVVTGVCLLHLQSHRCEIFSDQTAVTFRVLDAETIHRYLALANPMDKAGAYAIQERGGLIIEGIEGSRSNVIGLPVERLRAALDAWESRRAG